MFSVLIDTLALIRERKRTVIFLVVSSLLITLLLLLEPFFYRAIIDAILHLGGSSDTSGNLSPLSETLIFWCIVGISIIILKLFITIYADRMAHEEFNTIIRKYFMHTLDLSIGYHVNTNS